MPAFNVTMPEPQGRFDGQDPEDQVARKIQVLDQSAVLVQQMLRTLKFNPATGSAYAGGSYLRPGHIVSGGGVTSYESDIDSALTAIGTVISKLKVIPALS